MTAPELEDALVEFIAANTWELRYRSNNDTDELVAPTVWAAFIPRDTVGEIVPGAITTYPCVIVRAKQGTEAKDHEMVTVELLIGVFDDSPDQQGSRDLLNLITRIKTRMREQSIIRQKFPLRFPLNWQVNKRSEGSAGYNNWPYFFGEMQLLFEFTVIDSQYERSAMSPESGEGRYDVPAMLNE